MSAHFIRNIALMITACMLAISLLCLPVCARTAESQNIAVESVTEPPSIGEEIDENALFPNRHNLTRGNLGDTNGDGKIEGDNHFVDQDPIHAIENMSAQNGGWITVIACIAAIIALVLIIVALIPKKRT